MSKYIKNSFYTFECVYYLILPATTSYAYVLKEKNKCSFLGVQWKTALFWSWAGRVFAKDKTTYSI